MDVIFILKKNKGVWKLSLQGSTFNKFSYLPPPIPQLKIPRTPLCWIVIIADVGVKFSTVAVSPKNSPFIRSNGRG